MQKYLLYRKGLRIADIDQDDVKRDAKLALSDWIERSRLFLDETEGNEAFTFRFVEMRGYKEGYEGLARIATLVKQVRADNPDGGYASRAYEC